MIESSHRALVHLVLAGAAIATGGCGAPRSRSPAPTADAERLVACWTDALGGRDRLARIRSIEREATTVADGLPGTLHLWSRADGALRAEAISGPRSSVEVFDGRRGWSRSRFEPVTELSHTELAELATRGYLESLAPLVPGRIPGHVRAGAQPATLVIGPDGGSDVIVALDPTSCLPRQYELRIGGGRTVIQWSRWTRVDGVQLPGHAQITSEFGDAQTVDYTATRFDGAEDTRFTAPGPDPRAHMPQLTEPLELPVEITQNHVYVQAQINGRGPVSLLVDTGCNDLLLDTGRAGRIGIAGLGQGSVHGAGDGSLATAVAAAPVVMLGGQPFALEAAAMAPLTAQSRYEGRWMEGVIGYELIGHYVAEFDYAAPVVRLHDPARFQPPAGAIALPFYFYDTKPIVEITIELADGRVLPIRAMVDTGNRAALGLVTGFVRQHGLLEGPGPRLRAPLGFGVGGQTKQALGRVAAIHLGSFTVRDVLTSFSEDKRGAFADRATDANLGGDVLRRFTVWFDYPRRQMWLRKNAQFGEPFTYDASGLTLAASDDTFHRIAVSSVVPGSAGDAAGVQRGDELAAIDGEAVAGLTLDAIRARLRVPGAAIRLALVRGGATRTVELTTRAQI